MEYTSKVDAREYAPKDKHRVIFETFKGLQPGQSMELINDHDPVPLKYQFMAEQADKFTWEYLEEGPDIWRVVIGRK